MSVKKHLKATLLLEIFWNQSSLKKLLNLWEYICKCKADAAMMVGRISNQRETFNFKKLFPRGEPLQETQYQIMVVCSIIFHLVTLNSANHTQSSQDIYALLASHVILSPRFLPFLVSILIECNIIQHPACPSNHKWIIIKEYLKVKGQSDKWICANGAPLGTSTGYNTVIR